MSNIKTKQPFQLPAQQRNQVGQNWEQRKTYLARGGGEVAPARQAPPRHVDQFLQGGKKSETVAHFDPKAAYRKARMHFMGAPFRPSAVEHLQNGTAPIKERGSRQWTDPELLRLLNLVVENPVYANRRSIQKARQAAAGTSPARKPAGPASPPAATQQQQQQYAMALRRSKVPSK